ncbi:MAG: UDP-N-acetylglucosamine 2-epimerase [Magnetospirillum sp.]|nr:UDP-N-acetylglucosamine 2-epimerase [Magnetospirillum sp.]
MSGRRRRVLVTLESRATMGYSMNVMRRLLDDPRVELQTLVTGSHLMEELGHTADLYTTAGIPISARVPMTPQAGPAGWSKAMGTAIAGYAAAYETLRPDIILLSGDRAETFALCVAAAYMGLPMAHIQAGDKSGHIDAPQLDDMVTRDFRHDSIEIDGRRLDLTQPYLLLLQHPLMVERDEAHRQMEASLRACLDTGLPLVWIYPNSDLGFRDILGVIEREKQRPQVVAVANVDRDDFLVLLANTACLVGNSSSGLLEAPTFKVPVVNVGDRQRGRPQASNLLNCPHDEAAIAAALATALGDEAFRARCTLAVNPFGDGLSSPRIAAILAEVALDKRLLDKTTTY